MEADSFFSHNIIIVILFFIVFFNVKKRLRNKKKADKNLPVIKRKRQLLDKQKLSKSCLYILSLNVCIEKQNKLANLLSSLLVCAFKLAQEA